MRLFCLILFVQFKLLSSPLPIITCCTSQYLEEVTLDTFFEEFPQWNARFNEQKTLVEFTDPYRPWFILISPPKGDLYTLPEVEMNYSPPEIPKPPSYPPYAPPAIIPEPKYTALFLTGVLAALCLAGARLRRRG